MNNITLPSIDLNSSNFWATCILITTFIIMRYLFVKTVTKWNFQDIESRKKWISIAKTSPLLILFIGVFFIWGTELRSLAISLMAVAAALVLATKELILCLTGGILKASTKLFQRGDRIAVNGLRGEVADHNFLITTLFEVGPSSYSNQFSGRYIKVPNSIFLTNSVSVTPAGNKYVLHVFTVTVPLHKNLKQLETHLLDSAKVICKEYFSNADKHIKMLCRKEGIDTPTIEPRVTYYTKDKENLEFNVRMPVEIHRITRIEKKLKDLFFNKYFEVINEDTPVKNQS